jgi:acetoin utilization protein AcuB
MTRNPVTVTTDTSLKDAFELLRSRPFRHLPVVDKEGKLAGIVTERSLVYASPTPATTLSVFEVEYILSHTSIGQVMHSPVITVGPDLPIEEAARIMVDHRIGCLPVIAPETGAESGKTGAESGKLIGIISDTDIFRVFVEGLGGGHPSTRITVVIPEEVGSLARVAGCIVALGGNIYSLGTFRGEKAEERVVTLRLEGVDRESAVRALEADGIQVVSVWEPPASVTTD